MWILFCSINNLRFPGSRAAKLSYTRKTVTWCWRSKRATADVSWNGWQNGSCEILSYCGGNVPRWHFNSARFFNLQPSCWARAKQAWDFVFGPSMWGSGLRCINSFCINWSILGTYPRHWDIKGVRWLSSQKFAIPHLLCLYWCKVYPENRLNPCVA